MGKAFCRAVTRETEGVGMKAVVTGAAFNALMEEETKESLAQMVCDGLDREASLKRAMLKIDDPPIGCLLIGTTGNGEVVINHPDLQPDANGVGHIILSVVQARDMATLLNRKAAEANRETVSPHNAHWRFA